MVQRQCLHQLLTARQAPQETRRGHSSKVAVGQFDVWTGTSTNGTSLEVDCAGWLTSNGFPDTGYEGRNNATNGNWTNTGLINVSVCSTKQRLYCFQQ